MGCFRNKGERYRFPSERQNQSNGSLMCVYICIYTHTYSPPLPFLLAIHNGKAKMEKLKKKS